MSKEVILFDLPSKGRCACWSLNPCNTDKLSARAALNFKDIPYKTEWTEYPDIEPNFKSYGIPANDPSVNPTPYSIPAVQMPDGHYIMDSRVIADALEKLKPSPSLHLDNGYTDKTQNLVLALLTPLRTELMPQVPLVLLNDSSAKFFQETRKKRFGMPLAEFAKCDQSGEVAWKNGEPEIANVGKLLSENEGPCIAGKEPTYADLILGGLWEFVKSTNPQAFRRLMDYNTAFPEHMAAISKYFERDDH